MYIEYYIGGGVQLDIYYNIPRDIIFMCVGRIIGVRYAI